MTFRKGDIILVPFPGGDLTTTKTRPAVVVSGDAFQAVEGRLLIAAITSNLALHQNIASFELPDWVAAGLKKPSIVTSWLACVAPRAVLHKVGELTHDELGEVGKRLRAALELP